MKILMLVILIALGNFALAENPISKPAVIVITDKISVDEDTEVILWGGESSGSVRNYIWKQTVGIPQEFSSLRSKRIVFTPPNLNKGHHVKIDLTVYDKDGVSNTKQIHIFVKNTDKSRDRVNLPPVAVTGGDQIVKSGQMVFLPCNLSHDPDGTIVKCEYVQTGGTPVDIQYLPTGEAYYVAPKVSNDSKT